MKIAMIASECEPFAKSGGLADVMGALPTALKLSGNDVIVIMPLYGSINYDKHNLQCYKDSMCIHMGNTEEWCKVHEGKLEGNVSVYFIESEKYFGRDGLYHDEHHIDYSDNPLRFGFLSRAALQFCIDENFHADIIHAHDWQTSLALAYQKIWHWNDPVIGKAKSVLTIHNIGYQGIYPDDHFDYLGLQWHNFTHDKFEDHGRINFLKGGIHYADFVNTVSPCYAEETRSPEFANGLAPYLNNKGRTYVGILNGVDYSKWNPEIDEIIPEQYSNGNMNGKSVNKRVLQERFHLEVDENVPVIGIVSRFADQKGLDVLAHCIENIISDMNVQFAILGSGDKRLEKYYGILPSRFPGKVGSYIGYSELLSHLVEAGSDYFIMPSLYEPCGLNQIYSLKYGTIPIVRATGGLNDTVEQYDERNGHGTGFKFDDLSPQAIYDTVGWAVSTYFDRKEHFRKLRSNAMCRHFSWNDSAENYLHMYTEAINNRSYHEFH